MGVILHILKADYIGNYTLLCTFDNGECKEVDLSPLLKFPAFEDLNDKEKFQEFGVLNTVFWSNGADIAPEWLFQNGKAV